MSRGFFASSMKPFSQTLPLKGVWRAECSFSRLPSSLLDVANGSPVEYRQRGKVESQSERDSVREFVELEEVVIAVIRGERNQEWQRASNKG